jgi:hypothetical protein
MGFPEFAFEEKTADFRQSASTLGRDRSGADSGPQRILI